MRSCFRRLRPLGRRRCTNRDKTPVPSGPFLGGCPQHDGTDTGAVAQHRFRNRSVLNQPLWSVALRYHSTTTTNTALSDEHGRNDNAALLEPWRDDVRKLITETNNLVHNNTNNASQQQKEPIADLIQQWHNLSHSLATFVHRSSPPSSSQPSSSPFLYEQHTTKTVSTDAQDLLIECALQTDRLLRHYTRFLRSFATATAPSADPAPFSQTVETWRRTAVHCVYEPCGQRAASALSDWGEFYGGDLERAPSVNGFNAVLEAYACGGSGAGAEQCRVAVGLMEEEEEEGATGSDGDGNGEDPATSVWEIYTLLSRSNDASLKPDTETRSHVVRALRNRATRSRFEYQRRGRRKLTEEEEREAREVAAVRAYSVWNTDRPIGYYDEDELYEMDDEEEEGEEGWYDETTRKRQQHLRKIMELASDKTMELGLRADLDILELSSYGLLHRHRDRSATTPTKTFAEGHETEELLRRILKHRFGVSTFTKPKILSSIATNPTYFTFLSDAYLYTMLAYCWEQEARVNFVRLSGRHNNNNVTDSSSSYSLLEQPHKKRENASAVRCAASTVSSLLDEANVLGICPQSDHYDVVVRAYANCMEEEVLGLGDEEGSSPLVSDCWNYLEELEEQLGEVDCNDVGEDYVHDDDGDDQLRLMRYKGRKIRASSYADTIWATVRSLHNKLSHQRRYHRTSHEWNRERLAIGDNAKELLDNMVRRYRANLLRNDYDQDGYRTASAAVVSNGPLRRRESSVPVLVVHAFNYLLLLYSECEGEGRGGRGGGGGGGGGYAAVSRSTKLYRRLLSLRSADERRSGDDRSGSSCVVRPDAVTYGAYLKTLSRSDREESGDIAWDVIKSMERRYENGRRIGGAAAAAEPRPNVAHYSAAILALCRGDSGNGKGTKRAYELLANAERLYNSQSSDERNVVDDDYDPVALYSAVISGWSRRRGLTPEGLGRKALGLLDRLQSKYEQTLNKRYEPDVLLYNLVLKTLSNERNGSGLEDAMSLLAQMETRYAKGETDVLPDRWCYTPVLVGWGRSGRSIAPVRIAALLERMEESYRKTGDVRVRPDVVAYTAAIEAWSRRIPGDDDVEAVVERVERALKVMEERKDEDERREGREDEEKGDRGLVGPTAVTYTAVMNCYWRRRVRDGGERAEELLRRMKSRLREGKGEAKPDFMTYTSAINAWASSESKEKATRAWSLFQTMKHEYEEGDLSVKPNAVTLTTILNACAHTPVFTSTSVSKTEEQHREAALRIALEVQTILLSGEYGSSDSGAFRTLIQAIGRLLPSGPRRRSFVSVAFERCCKEGLVDEAVLGALERFAPELYRNLPVKEKEEGVGRLRNIPEEWVRNVKGGRRRGGGERLQRK